MERVQTTKIRKITSCLSLSCCVIDKLGAIICPKVYTKFFVLHELNFQSPILCFSVQKKIQFQNIFKTKVKYLNTLNFKKKEKIDTKTKCIGNS